MGRGYRRRKYISDKGYQWRFVLATIGICAAGMVLALAVFNFLAYRGIESYTWRVHVEKSTAAELIMPYLLYSNVPALVLTIMTLSAFACFMILRTAPPVFRMKKYIDSAARGNLDIGLDWAAYDEFRETAEDLDRMVAALRERFIIVKERGDAVVLLSSIIPYVAEKPEAAREKCEALIKELEGLKSALEALKAGGD